MSFNPLKSGVIFLFLGASPSLAQVGAPMPAVDNAWPSGAVGVVPPAEEAEIDPEATPDSGEEAEVPDARAFRFEHKNGFVGSEGELGQILEAGDLSLARNDVNHLSRRALTWDLGLSPEYSLGGGLNVLEERRWEAHRPAFSLGVSGRGFKGAGATLDEIYQGAYRSNQDFSSYQPGASRRLGGAVRLGDTYSFKGGSSFTVGAEARTDRSEIPEALDEVSGYQALNLRSLTALNSQQSLDLSFRRSFLSYEDDRNNFRQDQAVSESELLALSRVSTSWTAGLGLRTLEKRNGPVAVLIKRPNERSEAQAKVSYLKGEGRDQVLGSFNGRYRWSRLLSFNLQAEQGLDLLATYSNFEQSGQRNIRQQRITKSYALQSEYDGGKSRWLLDLKSARQDYESSYLTQREASLTWTERWSRLDAFDLKTSLRHYAEHGAVMHEVDRRQVLVDLGWKHALGLDSRLFGPQNFAELGFRYERLWEGSVERERKTLLLALGQVLGPMFP